MLPLERIIPAFIPQQGQDLVDDPTRIAGDRHVSVSPDLSARTKDRTVVGSRAVDASADGVEARLAAGGVAAVAAPLCAAAAATPVEATSSPAAACGADLRMADLICRWRTAAADCSAAPDRTFIDSMCRYVSVLLAVLVPPVQVLYNVVLILTAGIHVIYEVYSIGRYR